MSLEYFVESFSRISMSLNNELKEGKRMALAEIINQEKEAENTLKEKMVALPKLALPHGELKLKVKADTYDQPLRAVFIQLQQKLPTNLRDHLTG